MWIRNPMHLLSNDCLSRRSPLPGAGGYLPARQSLAACGKPGKYHNANNNYTISGLETQRSGH